MPEEKARAVQTCPLCLRADDPAAMVKVDIPRTILGYSTNVVLCQSCALGIWSAVEHQKSGAAPAAEVVNAQADNPGVASERRDPLPGDAPALDSAVLDPGPSGEPDPVELSEASHGRKRRQSTGRS